MLTLSVEETELKSGYSPLTKYFNKQRARFVALQLVIFKHITENILRAVRVDLIYSPATGPRKSPLLTRKLKGSLVCAHRKNTTVRKIKSCVMMMLMRFRTNCE